MPNSPRPALLALATSALALAMLLVSDLHGQSITFSGPELLGRPTADSIAVNIVATGAIDAYAEYGTTSGSYSTQTSVVSAAANDPVVISIPGLQADTQYFYRLQYRPSGSSTWTPRDEHSFRTQRSAGSTFTFTVTSDSHLNIVFGNGSLWQRTLLNVNDDHPDLHFDLGDTFAMDNVTTQAAARTSYLSLRPYFGLMSHSTPVFIVLGNHEEEEAWHRDDTGNIAMSKPILGANARKRYYLNPSPNTFYSGNTDAWAALDGDQLPGDYYAFQWGDALFVAIDPYWYTTSKPFIGNNGGGESSDPGTGDRWDWTLGPAQYQWLKQTLETSPAKFKFIFAHHGTGGTDDYIRGGANAVPFTEWGGRNEDGVTWAFDTRRPGWYAPVHQLLVENHVSAFFHGHDHEYAHEERDGVVYQAVPMGAESGYGFGFGEYQESDPYTIRVLPNSGHLRVTVASSGTTVQYVRAFLPGDGTNATVADTYLINAPSGGPNLAPTVATAASATPSPVTGTTTSVSALGADDNGEANLTYTWTTTGTPPAAVTFGPNGTNAAKTSVATFTRAGTYTLQVTIRDAGNLSVASTVNVTVAQTLSSISVSPAPATVVAGGTQLFSASACDQFGVALSTQPSIDWIVSGGGTIAATGLFTAGATPGGPFVVTASSGITSGTANVTVTPTGGVPVAYVQGAGSTNDGSATSIAQAFSAPVTVGDLIVVAVSWGTNGTLTCSDSQSNSYAVATTQYDSTNAQSLAICYAANAKAGSTTVTATISASSSYRRMLIHEYRGIAPANPVDVVRANLANGTTTANAITSQTATTTVNGDLLFGAVMDDAGVTAITAGSGFTQRLSLNNKDLATEDQVQSIAGSIATTQTFGASHRYLAQMVAFKAGAAGPPNLAPTVATPAAASPSPVTATTTSLSVLGADDGGEAGLTYTWATTGTPPAAAVFSANGTNAAKSPTATFTKAGSYSFQVTIKDAANQTVTSTVGVTVSQTLTAINVTPANASVGAGTSQSSTASAIDQFGATLAPQPGITWTVSGGGSISAIGLFTAGGTAGGPFTVTAANGAINGTASVTVTPGNAPPTVATAAAASPSPVTATTTSLSVLGADDAAEAGLTYTWATTGTPPAAVTFSANGTNAAKNTTATFVKVGSYNFQVTIRDAGNLTTTSTVNIVVSGTLTSITVLPSTATVVTNASQQFTATGVDQFGAALTSQPSFTWAVAGGGTIGAGGLFTAGSSAGGPFSVTATSGAVIGSGSLTVTAPSAVGYVQGSSLSADGSASNIARAFTAGTTAGNLVVVAVSWGNSATVTCSDSQGNTYAVATTQFDSTNTQSLAICYAANVKAGANTVTATFSASAPYRRILIHEYQGIALSTPVDVTAKNLANGTTTANAVTSTAAVQTLGGALVFGAVMDDAGVNNITAGSGFTLRQSVNNKDLASEDQVRAATGAVATTFTFSAAHRYLAQIVVFKPR